MIVVVLVIFSLPWIITLVFTSFLPPGGGATAVAGLVEGAPTGVVVAVFVVACLLVVEGVCSPPTAATLDEPCLSCSVPSTKPAANVVQLIEPNRLCPPTAMPTAQRVRMHETVGVLGVRGRGHAGALTDCKVGREYVEPVASVGHTIVNDKLDHHVASRTVPVADVIAR